MKMRKQAKWVSFPLVRRKRRSCGVASILYFVGVQGNRYPLVASKSKWGVLAPTFIVQKRVSLLTTPSFY
jgi:hypothetical protein